jgi:uncharacterized paraquat-inducible protein A
MIELPDEFFEWLNDCPVQWFRTEMEEGSTSYVFIHPLDEVEDDSDFVTCPHCEHVVSYSGLIGETTDDCPCCGKPVLEKVKDEQI